jgi:acetyl-CoA acyltransferase
LVAERYGITRDAMDDFGYESHLRAVKAQREGRFDREILPVVTESDGSKVVFDSDEGPRPDADRERMRTLKPAFKPDGRITAGSSSQISDGASAMLVMSEEKANELGLTPRARFHAFALAGADPLEMLTAPIPATQKILDRTGLTLDDIDLVEINEAFAVVPLAWANALGADLAKVNVNGGACALGHPLGATGVRMTTTLLNELERTGGRYGLQTICEGGGLANATIIERLG